MTAESAPPRFRAFRHLLTSAEAGARGASGFQTVAAAGSLLPELIADLETAVGSFRLPAGDSGHPALQLLRWDDNFHLLSRFQPLPAGDGERGGNYLAESLLVPTPWLAAAGWDAAAAFAAVDWWGAEALGRLGDDAMALPEEPLPPLAPGSLDRLAALAELAPGDLLDHLLLGVVAWAVRGERLVVVEARPERPEDLATVVALLPLALPPSCRSGRRGGGPRSIELRTRGPARGMPAVDLAGVVAADLDLVAANGGRVVDLGGRLEPEPQPDLDGYDYVQWAKGALREGRWQEMAEVYRRAEEVPPAELFRRFRDLRRAWSEEGAPAAGAERPAAKGPRSGAAAPAATRPGPAPRRGEERPARPAAAPAPLAAGEAAPGALDERRARWQVRRQAESALARGHDAWAAEAAALVAALEAENQRALDALHERIEAVGGRLAERLRSEREALWDESRRALEAQAVEAQKRLHRETERSLEQVRREGDALLRDLERRIERGERAAARPGAAAAAPAGGWRRWWRRGSDGGTDWRKVGTVAAVVAVLAVLGWLGWRAWGPGSPGEAEAAAADDGRRDPAGGDLAARLRDPAVARGLLLRAREDPALAEPAATAALALVLGDAPPPGAADRCLLVQAALRRQRETTPPPAVDGDCGPATSRTLAAATQGSCCAELSLAPSGFGEERAACYLGGVFALPDEERCTGRDPFAAGREWSEREAANALALLRAAGETATGAAAARAAALAAAHDLAASPAVAERAAEHPVSAAEADLLLGLARALAAPAAGGGADDAAVAALLDELAPPTGP